MITHRRGGPSSRFDEFILDIININYRNKISQICLEDLRVFYQNKNQCGRHTLCYTPYKLIIEDLVH